MNKLYAVNGVGFSLEDKPMSIFSVDLASNTMSAWNPAQDGVDLIAPHDLAISLDGKYIFVADMAPQPRIWKFENGDFQQANSEWAADYGLFGNSFFIFRMKAFYRLLPDFYASAFFDCSKKWLETLGKVRTTPLDGNINTKHLGCICFYADLP